MTRDVMGRLAAARPPALDPAPDALRRERDLRFITTQPFGPHANDRRAPRTARRTTFGLGLGAAAAVVAAAVATAVGLNVVGHGSSAPPARNTPSDAARLGDRSIVLAAAAKAERLPMGTHWYTDQVEAQTYLVRAKTGAYAIEAAAAEFFEWTATTRDGGNLFYGRDLPARPQTNRDVAAWRRAGSPTSFRVWSNDHYGTYTTKAGRWKSDVPQAHQGNRFFVPGFPGGVTLQRLQSLPADPATLARTFFAAPTAAKANRKPGVGRPLTAARKVGLVGEVLLRAPIAPKVQAGLMRVLLDQPGVAPIGTVTDPLGRKGVALAAPDPAPRGPAAPRGYTTRREIIFAKDTGEFLSSRTVLVKPGGQYRDQKPGFVIFHWSSRGTGWTDTRPKPPATLPY
jgi:hypothetical protein